MLHQDRVRAQLFGRDAVRYDRARPSYPAVLIDDLVAGKPGLVLDVGCGTGKAARMFAARGCQVLGIEPDDRMAAVARSHGIEVEVATFEEWNPAARTFDLVVSGQAWHWVDNHVGPRKAAEVLPSQAKLGVFWNQGAHDSETGEQLAEAYQRYAPHLTAGYAPHGNLTQRLSENIAAITSTGTFETPEVKAYEWVKTYSRDEWLDQLGTHSDHLLLPAKQLDDLADAVAAAIERLGGTITVYFQTHLIVAARK